MSGPGDEAPSERRPIGRRPGADPAAAWLRHEGEGSGLPAAALYTARLTVDVTPALRARIKLAAFGRGETVSAMLRALLEQRFPDRAP